MTTDSELWAAGGWFGNFGEAQPPSAILARMLGGAAYNSRTTLTHIGQQASIGLTAGTPGRDLAVEDRLCVAIFGQPWWSHATQVALAEQHGHAAAALAAYRRWGRQLFEHLHGPFWLVILDGERGEIIAATDRLGIQPLSYAIVGQGVVFGTSATTVARHPVVGRELSPQGLFNYLFFYRVPAPGSIFAKVSKLLPAQVLHFASGRGSLSFYWQMPFATHAPGDRHALRDQLFGALRLGVRRAIEGTPADRMGTFLSGGLDSSVITGLTKELSQQSIRAFTIGFDSPGYDERAYARITARHFGINHLIYEVTPADVLDAVPRIAAAYDEPFGNASAVPVYYCARFAHSAGVETLIAGDGGDELFAGNASHLRMKLFELYGYLPAAMRGHLIEPLVARLPQSGWNVLGRKARSYIAAANIPMPDRLFEFGRDLSLYANTVLEPDWLAGVDPENPLQILREVYARPAKAAFEQRMHQLELQVILADNDLRKVNRMCALAGIGVRFPMLDEAVCEFSASIPPELLLKGLKLRSFFKQCMVGFLPSETLKKTKHGFGLPFGPWLAPGQKLQEFAYDCIAALKGRRILTAAHIDAVVEAHRRDPHPDNAGPLWDLMMLELWLAAHVIQDTRQT